MSFSRSIILGLFLGMGFTSSAQKIWTLEQCLYRATEQSFLVEQNKATVEDAAIDYKQAKHGRYPNLSATTNANWNFGRTIDPTTNTFNTASFFNNGFNFNTGAVLYNGNRINHTIALSQTNLKANLQDLEQAKRDIVLNVATVYLNLLFAKENREIASLQLIQSQEQRALLERQIQVGNRPENDRFELDAQIAENNQRLIQAENNIKLQILNLKQLLRLELSQDFDIATPDTNLTALTDPDIISYDELFASALKREPSVQANLLRMKSAQLNKKIADAEAIPNLSVFGGVRTIYSSRGFRLGEPTVSFISLPASFGGEMGTLTLPQPIRNIQESPYSEQFNDNISYFVGLNLNIPIYSNYAIKGGQQRAKINIQRSQLSYDQSIENLKITVGQALTDARVAKSQYLAAQQSMQAQQNLYDNTLKRYEIGSANTFELARIKTQMESAVFNEVLTRYEYLFRVKILDFYMGIPIETSF